MGYLNFHIIAGEAALAPEVVRLIFTQSEVEQLITMSVYRRLYRRGDSVRDGA